MVPARVPNQFWPVPKWPKFVQFEDLWQFAVKNVLNISFFYRIQFVLLSISSSILVYQFQVNVCVVLCVFVFFFIFHGKMLFWLNIFLSRLFYLRDGWKCIGYPGRDHRQGSRDVFSQKRGRIIFSLEHNAIDENNTLCMQGCFGKS